MTISVYDVSVYTVSMYDMSVYDVSAYVISVLTYLGMAITVHDTSVYLVYSVYLVGVEEGSEVSEAQRWSNNKTAQLRI